MMGIRTRYAFSVLLCAVLMAFIGLAFSGQTRAFTSAKGTEFHRRIQQGAKASLAAGKFLVADRNIRGSLFSEAVIILVEYGHEGAMGLMINHPTDAKLPDVLPDLKGAGKRRDKIHIGGPVGLNRIFILCRSAGKPDESLHVFGDVYVSDSEKVLERMIAKPEKGEKFRLYAGYSGWSAGQLENEVSRGDWHVVDADAESIFDKKSSAVWQDLIEKASGQWVEILNRQPHYLSKEPLLFPYGTPNPPVQD